MHDERLLIGEIARRSGVSADTIRHYESKGVLGVVGRDPSGYRRYAVSVVRRVAIVRRALQIGFTLDELARIFRQRESGNPPCRGVRELASRKLVDIEQRIATLEALRVALIETVSRWDVRLNATDGNGLAHLLESLVE